MKKHLLSLSKEQVVNIMLQLYDASKEAAGWFEFYLEPNNNAELEKYKKAIRSQFYGRNNVPKDPSFRECNKLITAFKKLIPDPYAIADLMIYYLEQGTSLPAQFGDFGETYSISLENNYIKMLKHVSSHDLMKEFTPRIKMLIQLAQSCGYGLEDAYEAHFNDYSE